MKNKKNIIAFAVIGVILIASIAAALIIQLGKEDGAYVTVEVNGVEVARYSLETDGEYELNGGTNTLRIKNGVAYMIDANCPDKTCCAFWRKIDQGGETITCLPNMLVVTVHGAGDDAPEIIV